MPRFAVVLLLFLLSLPAQAQMATVAPEGLGFSSERLARLDGLFEQHVADGEIAGAVALILRDGEAVHLRSYGQQDRAAGTPMPTDAIFRIASMSKAVTSVAVMMLYEEGHFRLGDPVARFIPAFEDPVVAVPAAEGSAAPYDTVPANRPITIRHLLTHTAGLTYGNGLAQADYAAASLVGWYFADKDETIGTAINRLATLPLHGQPGEVWQYGYSTDVLGYLVEVVSGMPLDRFFAERIFAPLGMRDSHFFLPPGKAPRLAPVYGRDADGVLTLREPTTETDYLHGPRRCFSGGAGLLSTITDYGRFLQMLLNGGVLEGARLLSPKSVELMQSTHVGKELYPWGATGFGLGFWVLDDLGAYGELGSEGAYGWGSAYYPIYWVDPEERLAALFLTQLMPAGDTDLSAHFQTLVYQALLD